MVKNLRVTATERKKPKAVMEPQQMPMAAAKRMAKIRTAHPS
jgi:hypothetical protein